MINEIAAGWLVSLAGKPEPLATGPEPCSSCGSIPRLARDISLQSVRRRLVHTDRLAVFDLFVALASKSFIYSGTFWGAVGGIAALTALVLGVPALWLTWRQANPKRRLLYGMPVAAPLLNAHGLGRRLEVRFEDQALAEPRVVEVTLFNAGRQAIPSDAFDRARPVVLDVGAPIVELLKVTTPPGHPGFAVEIDGPALRIGPDLIPRRQKLSFSLLVDGPTPKLSCREAPLIDIDVRPGNPPDPADALTLTQRVRLTVLMMVLVPAAWLLAGLIDRLLS
jgi:hypothetical protein